MVKYYITKTEFWIRIFGCGISGKNLNHHSLIFSERQGLTKTIQIFNWSFRWLKQYKN